MGEPKKPRPRQKQTRQPGRHRPMKPQPQAEAGKYLASDRLLGKAAIITGGDSGIGRAVAACFAKEGADVLISYLDEHDDAAEARRLVEAEGRRCVLMPGDIGPSRHCREIVRQAVRHFGKVDILVNNAAEQHPVKRPEDLTDQQLQRTFATNIFAMFYLSREALPHMGSGATIINTTSVTAYVGHETLLDYATTKGAIVAFTRSMALALAKRGIRVNAVAPGPIWTPLIPASFPEEKVETFGTNVPLGRAGQPDEVAPCYVFLASQDSSYMTGQVLHSNGGWIVNG